MDNEDPTGMLIMGVRHQRETQIFLFLYSKSSQSQTQSSNTCQKQQQQQAKAAEACELDIPLRHQWNVGQDTPSRCWRIPSAEDKDRGKEKERRGHWKGRGRQGGRTEVEEDREDKRKQREQVERMRKFLGTWL